MGGPLRIQYDGQSFTACTCKGNLRRRCTAQLSCRGHKRLLAWPLAVLIWLAWRSLYVCGGDASELDIQYNGQSFMAFTSKSVTYDAAAHASPALYTPWIDRASGCYGITGFLDANVPVPGELPLKWSSFGWRVLQDQPRKVPASAH